MDLDQLTARAFDVHALYDRINLRDRGRTWTREEFMLGFVGDVGDLAKLAMAAEGAREIDVDPPFRMGTSCDARGQMLVLSHPSTPAIGRATAGDADLERDRRYVCGVSVDFSSLNERDALATFLDLQRDALVRKVRGVSDADARRTPTVSSLSLLGLLKHSAVWEQRWFQGIVAGRRLSDGWPDTKSPIPGQDFLVDDQDTVEHWVARYEQTVETSRQIVATLDLGQPCARKDIVDFNVRSVVLHMIEETARHAGHADLIRETIDGSRGL